MPIDISGDQIRLETPLLPTSPRYSRGSEFRWHKRQGAPLANVTKLLHSASRQESFLLNLTITEVDDAKLREARRSVRQHLRATFADQSLAKFGVVVAPRFFTQGSFSYKTINEPAWTPPQQMDMDDGCYLPLTFVKGQKPSVAARQFFSFVDAALRVLASRKGWQFVEKPTCSRLIIDSDAHIDVPLYAIPDAEFATLAATRARQLALDTRMAKRSGIESWSDLPRDSVLLAHREEDWKVSDPRKIHNWFINAVGTYGEVLRRISRYLKGWRDYHSPKLDGVSSILLMACAFRALEEVGKTNIPGREDEALLKVVERLPRLLQGPVMNPAEPTEKLCGRLDDEARATAVAMAHTLHGHVRTALSTSCDRASALASLKLAFGGRMPDRPDLVEVTQAAQAAIQSQPSRIVPAPTVGRSQSG